MESLRLNENQQKAILHKNGPMIVLSGPGSGKTTVITYRVKNLIENYNISPNEILVITFTKAASEEMKERFKKICSSYYNVSFSTFHSYFFRIIRENYKYELSNILDDNEKAKIIKSIINKHNIYFDNMEEFVQSIISEISLLKNELINPNYFNSRYLNSNNFNIVYNEYELLKNQQNKIDFDDMLIQCYYLLKDYENIRKFWINKYKYILIDEFQDINKVQYECIKILCEHKNIFVVGDDDQSIYGFRGSRPEFLLNFPKDFENTKKVILNVNYRSTNQIINLCNKVILENNNRYAKNIVGTNKENKQPILIRAYDAYEEAKKIVGKIQTLKNFYPLEEIAIIYRTNLQARAVVEILKDYNIEYQLKDNITSIYEHFIAKDIICYLSLASNKLDNESFLKIANKPKRFLNKNMLQDAFEKCKNETSILEYLYCKVDLKSWQMESINELLFHLEQIKSKNVYDAIKYIIKTVGYESYLEEYVDFKNIGIKGLLEILNEVLDSAKGYEKIEEYLKHIENMKQDIFKKYKNNNQRGIVLTTMHSVKGLEFDVVFVIGCIDGIIPHEKSKSYIEIEEERRLFYVAITRAKVLLYISILNTKYEEKSFPSRFLKNLINIKR